MNEKKITHMCALIVLCSLILFIVSERASQVVLVVRTHLPKQADVRDTGWIPGSGRSPGGGHSNPLQYSCLETPKDRGA